MAQKRIQLIVRGRVQGVYFRAATQREARRLGISGWVRNRNDGSIEMVAEGDIRLNADSFEREREVHKHIGDFILFWSGIYPEFLRHLKLHFGCDLICDYTRQGRESYYVVSTFDHAPYDREANTFRKLSSRFEEYTFCLRQVRETIPLSLHQGGSA